MQKKFASKNQHNNLRYTALSCALFYADYDTASFTVDGVSLKGLALKEFVQKCNSNNDIPNEIKAWMYKSFINRKIHDFLKEGNFRYQHKAPKYPDFFDFYTLNVEECNYLIIRFRKMLHEIGIRYEDTKTDYKLSVFN